MKSSLNSVSAVVAIAMGLIGCQSTGSSTEEKANPKFVEVSGAKAPFDDKARRKWDNALVSDLDQDGWLDFVITEHAFAAKIFWNNGGQFSEPQVLIKGDTHGMTAGDIDKDGRMDIIVSQGGGGGKKPRLPVRFQVNKDRTVERIGTYDHFERSRGRAAKLFDADKDGDLDLVLSAFPLKSQPKGANHLYVNDGKGNFSFVEHLPVAQWLGYKTLVGDLNRDGESDLIFYGGEDMVTVKGIEGMGFANVTSEWLGDLAKTAHTSSISEFDYDNDGDIDLFLTRAKHQFKGQSFYDEVHKRFAFFARFKPAQYPDLKVEGNLILENLQMAYPHFDVFLGAEKAKIPQAKKDRNASRDLEITPEQATGWPQERTKKGLYIGYLGEGIWRVASDTKSPTAAVIHNVVEAVEAKGVEALPAKLFENQDGKYVEVTAAAGIDVNEQATSSAVGDYNNDGWLDLAIIRYGDMSKQTEQILYMNQQGKGFKAQSAHGIFSKELGATGGGIEAFDYDKDGDIDLLYANERGYWHLFDNNSQGQGNFVGIQVGDSPKAKASPIAATIRLKACGETYTKWVASTSAQFSMAANELVHFGLGQCSELEKVTIEWANGEIKSMPLEQLNQYYKL